MKSEINQARLMELLRAGNIRIFTDSGMIDLSELRGVGDNAGTVYETPWARVTVFFYAKCGETVYRHFTVQCKENLTLYRIDFLTDFLREPRELLMYRSFLNAPAAAFARYGSIGYYTGVENPFFSTTVEGSKVCISYEPSLILKKGNTYESEPQFLGVYEPIGEYIRETEPVNIDAVARGVKRPRFFNPCGEIPLDIAEIEAMRKYAAEYYDVNKKSQFDNIFYFFFYPKKQNPRTESEVREYLSVIDRFSAINGDIMVFNPHVKMVMPTEEKPYWELAPKGTAAERILRYAQSSGLRCGYYMGVGIEGGGNGSRLPFRPEKKDWKKADGEGNLGGENCLGCDEYLEWWYSVQKNTIEKYGLGYWSWDPGPGDGNDCFATNHGHIPGKGEYKGWRNSQKLLARMKEQFPNLFLMSFYGRKEYGLWGFRYFSQHEVYWENTVMFGATLHNDLHDDRMNAHGIRLQNQWCMNFRFMPANIGHGLVPRMGESWLIPEIDRAYDLGGWRYALLSAIACCGSVTHCTLPDRLENVPGFTEFYRKWIKWAKDNYHYCQFTMPIGDRVSDELIDGFARIDRDNGQIFLFNSSPKVLNKKLPLDRRLGIDTADGFYLRILYCGNEELDKRTVQYRGRYNMGDVLDIVLSPYGAVVLELSRSEAESVWELPRHTHTIDKFMDTDGNLFCYPYHDACEDITLTARATFLPELKSALDEARTGNEKYLLEKIPEWHRAGIPFTFAGALPHRLVMFIPFEDLKLPEDIRLFINEREVPVETFSIRNIPVFHYAFAEDYVDWARESRIELRLCGLAPNSFMGIHVDYPDACQGLLTEEIVFQEHPTPSNLYVDPSLTIDSFEIAPEILEESGGKFTVTVKTAVPMELIESVYYLHPAKPMMSELEYDPEKQLWSAVSDTGDRSKNIFCNSKVTAWIKAKDGGVGPRAERRVHIRFSGK